QGGVPEEWTADSVRAAAARITLARHGAGFAVQFDGAPLGKELHEQAVTALVSLVARMQPVRAWVNGQMLACAREGAIVVDGRDMGTAVFPKAQLKVFLVANPRERARRR